MLSTLSMKVFSRLRQLLWVAIPCLVALLGFLWSLEETSPYAAPEFPRAELTIERADGSKLDLHVEVATSMRQEQYGLMYRKSLPHDAGMIFIQEPDEQARFWMKNTLIPLDMLFVRRDGTIAQVAANAKPLSLDVVGSDEAVHGIIEINGGDAEKLNIKAGEKVIFPGFGH